MTTNMDDKQVTAALRGIISDWESRREFLNMIPDSKSGFIERAASRLEALQSPADAGVVTDEMVRRATDAFWSKEVRETENQTLRMRVALKAALSTKPEAGSGDYVRGLQRAAEIAMEENERRIALASIRVPAMAVEIRDAILKEAATQPPTPASGEQMEVARWALVECGPDYDGMELDPQGEWVKYDDHAKALTAANERAERLKRNLDRRDVFIVENGLWETFVRNLANKGVGDE